MGLLGWIRLHNRDNRAIREELQKITNLPDESRIEKLGGLLHHLCVEYAAGFVQEQLRRGKDSQFLELDKGRFFHEMLLLNYWLVDRVMGGKDKTLLNEIQKQYLLSFHHLSGAEAADDLAHVEARFRDFTYTWDDVTGHLDIFAEKFAEYLFAGEKNYHLPSVAFLVITHATDTEKKLRDFKTICRELHIRTKASGKGIPESTRA